MSDVNNQEIIGPDHQNNIHPATDAPSDTPKSGLLRPALSAKFDEETLNKERIKSKSPDKSKSAKSSKNQSGKSRKSALKSGKSLKSSKSSRSPRSPRSPIGSKNQVSLKKQLSKKPQSSKNRVMVTPRTAEFSQRYRLS